KKCVLRRLGKQGVGLDAYDPLGGDRRVGKEPARVPPATSGVRFRPDETQRVPRRGSQPRAELERRPIMLPAAERDEDSRPALDLGGAKYGHVGRRPVKQNREIFRHQLTVEPRWSLNQD